MSFFFTVKLAYDAQIASINREQYKHSCWKKNPQNTWGLGKLPDLAHLQSQLVRLFSFHGFRGDL